MKNKKRECLLSGLGNFRDENGKLFLVRCPECCNENYAPAVATGQCVWCGWREDED